MCGLPEDAYLNAGITCFVRISRLRSSRAVDKRPPGFSSAATPFTRSSSRSWPRRSTSPGPPPRLAIRLETRRQLGNVHAAQPDEDGQAHPGDPRERLRRGRGHPDRRVRLLVRARDDADIGEAVEPALVAERLALPGLE